MNIIFISILLIIIICIFLIWYTTIYNKFQILIIKINEAESNIDTILRKRFDLLNKSVNIIKSNLKIDEEIFKSLSKLRSKKISNFDLDRQLYDAINEFYNYKNNYEEIDNCDEIIKIESELNESEYQINALRKYYNDIITEYNEMIRKFPTNFVAKFSKNNERTYYDGKNLNDDITNDFKL